MRSCGKHFFAAASMLCFVAAGCDEITGLLNGEPRIVFASNRDGNFEIYTMHSNGTDPVRLTTDAARRLPDFIVWTSTRDGNAEIYGLSADAIQVRLTNNTFVDENASVK